MKYIVMEIQTGFDGTVGNLVTTYDNQADAESAYYLILAAAVKSNLMIHTAMLFTNDGNVIMSKNYVHESEPNNE
jgi:hypothetical protein